MAKQYIIRSFKPGDKSHNRPQRNTLINLSALGLNSQQSILRHSLAQGASETSRANMQQQALFPYEQSPDDNAFSNYRDITKNQSESYSYYDMDVTVDMALQAATTEFARNNA